MALIQPDQLATLISASAAKTVADTAIQDAEEMSIAKLINSSANTGMYEVLYNHPISSATISTLEGQGYTVTQVPASKTSSPEFQYVISWKV